MYEEDQNSDLQNVVIGFLKCEYNLVFTYLPFPFTYLGNFTLLLYKKPTLKKDVYIQTWNANHG